MILTRDRGNRMWRGEGVSGGGGGGVSSSQLAGMLIGYATETWVDEHYISIDFFSRLFQAHGTENGSEIDVLPNDMDTTITSVESMFGFWTNLYISALGSNGAAPAGISLGMLTDVTISGTPSAGQVLTFDAAKQKWVNGNAQAGVTALANLTDVTITSLQGNQILIYDANTQKWANSSVKTINGNSIFGTGDIPASGGGTGNYLPLAGGIMTGNIQFNYNGNYYSTSYNEILNWQGSLSFNLRNSELVLGRFGSNGFVFDFSQTSGQRLYFNNTGGITAATTLSGDIGSSSVEWNNTFTRILFVRHINGSRSFTWDRSDVYINSYDGNALPVYGNTLINPDNDGKVGIGTGSPSFKLDVNGQAIVESKAFLCQYGLGINRNPATGGVFDSSSNGCNFIFNPENNCAEIGVCLSSGGYIAAIDVTTTGNVGIRTLSPSYTLHVVGTIYATGAITALSDARKKDITGEAGVTVEQIAHAPAVQFMWKDKERRKDGQQVGTLAQYWNTVLPEVVSDKGGELSMQYGVAALVSAIITARKVVDHERRITELEKENERLKEEISQLRLN